MTASTNAGLLDRTRERVFAVGHRLFARVPAWMGGHLHRLPTFMTFGVTGPFNGQKRRQAAVEAVFRAVAFPTVIETGTFRALTTMYLSRISSARVATVEVNPRYYDYSRKRLARFERVSQFLGHSPEVLDRLRTDPVWQPEPVFFYLDAHWLNDLPLVDELHAIRRGWQEFVALIDDFKVDGDDGYQYDDYGPGKALELSLLADVPEFADLLVFWPAARSLRETGARRGWVIVASPGAMADGLADVEELRAAGRLGG